MKTDKMHEAKTHLSKLIDDAVKGKPLVKAVMIEVQAPRRIGFPEGQFDIPDDFDTVFAEEIREMFEGSYIEPLEQDT